MRLALLFCQIINQPMIKTEQKGKRIHMTRTRPNFTIRSLIDQGFSSPQLFLQISSISPTQTSLSKNIKIRLEEEINSMLDQITRIINENQVNLREGMNYVRSSILFKDIDEINTNVVNEIVGEFAKNKIQDLEMALHLKTAQLQRLKKEVRQQQDFKEDNLKINKVPRISLPKQHDAELLSLYSKAKSSSYEKFQELYKQIQCGNKLEFIQISTITPKEKRQSTKHSDGKEEKKGRLMKVLSPLLNNLSENQRVDLLEILKEQLAHQCQNPCCKWIDPPLQPRNRMTALNFPRKQAKTTSFYKSDKVNQYYKRYYHSAFEVDKIRNVVKTEGDQMEKLYKVHKSKEKSTGKYRSHRCQSTV